MTRLSAGAIGWTLVLGGWLLAAGGAARATAQEPVSRLERGDRVRVRAPSWYLPRATATVIGQDRDGLMLRMDGLTGPRTIPYRDIAALEVQRGRHSAVGHAAVIGALIGGLGLGVTAAIASATCEGWGCLGLGWPTVAVSTGVGALVGGGLGAAVGSAYRRDVWHAVRLPGRAPSSGLGLRVGPATTLGWSIQF